MKKAKLPFQVALLGAGSTQTQHVNPFSSGQCVPLKGEFLEKRLDGGRTDVSCIVCYWLKSIWSDILELGHGTSLGYALEKAYLSKHFDLRKVAG
jgi:hypothetical protein